MRERHLILVIAGAVLAAFVIGCSSGGEDTPAVEQVSADDRDVVVELATIYPQPARANNRLEVKFKEDPWVNPKHYHFEWRSNGEVIIGPQGRSLEPHYFRKGDRISVEVSFVSTQTGARHKEQAATTILNTGPVVLEAETVAAVQDNRLNIYVDIRAVDADDDPLKYAYQWFRNNEPIELQTRETLDPSLCGRGDEVYCMVVAHDGEAGSLPLKSSSLELDNHAPSISSNPPSRFNERGEFLYLVAAADADGDMLTFKLLEAPEDMSMDDKGQISWAPKKEWRGRAHKVRVQVADTNGGVTVQEFDLEIPEED